MGAFIPEAKKSYSIPLNSDGGALVQQWLGGVNNGIVISSGGTSNGLDFDSKETGVAAKLELEYSQPAICQ